MSIRISNTNTRNSTKKFDKPKLYVVYLYYTANRGIDSMIIEYTCIICNQECRRSRSPANMKTIPKFCSQKCSGKYKSINKKGPTQNFKGKCIQCGNEFTTYKAPSRDIPKFCSIKCIGKYQSGENNPAFNGGKYISNGYYVLFMPDHPNRDIKNMVYEHRYVMECKLGRYLTIEECVHHIDHNKLNNKPENLMLFKNNSEHIKYHNKEKNND